MSRYASHTSLWLIITQALWSFYLKWFWTCFSLWVRILTPSLLSTVKLGRAAQASPFVLTLFSWRLFQMPTSQWSFSIYAELKTGRALVYRVRNGIFITSSGSWNLHLSRLTGNYYSRTSKTQNALTTYSSRRTSWNLWASVWGHLRATHKITT